MSTSVQLIIEPFSPSSGPSPFSPSVSTLPLSARHAPSSPYSSHHPRPPHNRPQSARAAPNAHSQPNVQAAARAYHNVTSRLTRPLPARSYLASPAYIQYVTDKHRANERKYALQGSDPSTLMHQLTAPHHTQLAHTMLHAPPHTHTHALTHSHAHSMPHKHMDAHESPAASEAPSTKIKLLSALGIHTESINMLRVLQRLQQQLHTNFELLSLTPSTTKSSSTRSQLHNYLQQKYHTTREEKEREHHHANAYLLKDGNDVAQTFMTQSSLNPEHSPDSPFHELFQQFQTFINSFQNKLKQHQQSTNSSPSLTSSPQYMDALQELTSFFSQLLQLCSRTHQDELCTMMEQTLKYFLIILEMALLQQAATPHVNAAPSNNARSSSSSSHSSSKTPSHVVSASHTPIQPHRTLTNNTNQATCEHTAPAAAATSNNNTISSDHASSSSTVPSTSAPASSVTFSPPPPLKSTASATVDAPTSPRSPSSSNSLSVARHRPFPTRNTLRGKHFRGKHSRTGSLDPTKLKMKQIKSTSLAAHLARIDDMSDESIAQQLHSLLTMDDRQLIPFIQSSPLTNEQYKNTLSLMKTTMDNAATESVHMDSAGLSNMNLLLQRDSYIKVNYELMRQNEILKLKLQQSEQKCRHIRDNIELEIRTMAENAVDSVGDALHDLEEFIDREEETREDQYHTMLTVSHFAHDLINRHANTVQESALADASYKESVATLKRVQARENEINAARWAEERKAEAEAQAKKIAREKADSLMPSQVRSIEVLDDEDIIEKVKDIDDIPTLHAMMAKVLKTKVKKRLNETHAQRLRRLRKESTPKLIRTILARNPPTDRLLPLKSLCRNIIELYFAKMLQDGADEFNRRPLANFTVDWYFQRFGLKPLAEMNVAEMARSTLVYLNPNKHSYQKYLSFISANSEAMMDPSSRQRLQLFSRLLHLYTDDPIPPEIFDFFMIFLRALFDACTAVLPVQFGSVSLKETAAENVKTMIKVMETTSVALNKKKERRSSIFDINTGTAKKKDKDDSQLAFFLPLTVVLESVATTFRNYAYTDEILDELMFQLENVAIIKSGKPFASSQRTRLLLRQILCRSMIKTAGTTMAFEKYDVQRTGSVSLEQILAQSTWDDELKSQLVAFCNRDDIGLTCITSTDFVAATHVDSRFVVSMDVVFILSIQYYMLELQQLTARYTAAFKQSDPTNHGLINHEEFQSMIQRMEPLKTKSSISKLFKECTDIQRLNDVIVIKKEKSGKSVSFADENDTNSSDAATTNAPTTATPPLASPNPTPITPVSILSPSSGSSASTPHSTRRRVSFLDQGPSSDLTSPRATRRASIIPTFLDTEFVGLDACIVPLRKARIGLPARKPYHELKSFIRRHNNKANYHELDEKLLSLKSNDSTQSSTFSTSDNNANLSASESAYSDVSAATSPRAVSVSDGAASSPINAQAAAQSEALPHKALHVDTSSLNNTENSIIENVQ